MGAHLRELSESYPMNTNMTGLDGFQKSLHSCSLDKSRFSIGRVKSTSKDKVGHVHPISNSQQDGLWITC